MKKVALFEKVSKERFCEDCSQSSAGEIYDGIRLPVRATTGSAGYDFFAPFDFSLKGGEGIKIPTGIRVKIDDGWFLQCLPRSGLGFRYRLTLDNTVGIIDSDYYYSANEGHIMIKMTNLSEKEMFVKGGDGFAQGIFVEYGITYDDETQGIRNGGFGSTDKK